MTQWHHSDSIPNSVLNAAVAKIFGGSLPEKIARCLGFYLNSEAPSYANRKALLFLRDEECEPFQDLRIVNKKTGFLTSGDRWKERFLVENPGFCVSPTFDIAGCD
jgi:hypothetical protein